MLNYAPLYQKFAEEGLTRWLALVPEQLDAGLDVKRYADLAGWQRVLEKFPTVEQLAEQGYQINIALDQSAVSIETTPALPDSEQAKYRNLFKKLMPWRKGPFQLHGTYINTEWRSDWKWDRLCEFIAPLHNRRILDVGCGSGYHCWRMAGAGARMVVGIDPSPRFHMQFQLLRRLMGLADGNKVFHLPVGIEDVPANLDYFDTVFSMGVLYHRPSPMDHLYQLKAALRPGGELVLETLVIDGDENQVLVPADRYAMMNNVWFLPSPDALVLWLKKCGFVNVRVVDISTTTLDEQRSTEWMTFHSLVDFLDPKDQSKTVEGYPAPKRAVVLAERPYH
ncbi:tRNA (mo5U34)-methyltransferase [Oceanospirillum multiglobuliferum]|uniref:tRNA U34 carboxymethyltransferase n=1 Tax=Oceanospirillum multiglobuliferum TaxID=64969 RepID=A0A1T4M8S9_9GAMM|nr:tRNA 5-methoxyuridine(34)/uridine 5-oxyacetic acid(34) synthase CmoB [Oceanospirillum multiglobuliferum]OPX56205.1 tRNA 5-methoxyuridine(34)/uridine 5-oxyacetic acid(34) synthase CmoB [Oceanospirillum multiglobuliferum]SJZ63295.1 tRNA (mo5U34)-methyltransferase [Oceanospirillum multiglobuliferum]